MDSITYFLAGVGGATILYLILNAILELTTTLNRMKHHMKHCDKRFYSLSDNFKEHMRKYH